MNKKIIVVDSGLTYLRMAVLLAALNGVQVVQAEELPTKGTLPPDSYPIRTRPGFEAPGVRAGRRGKGDKRRNRANRWR